MYDLKALVTEANDLVERTPDVETELAEFSKYMSRNGNKMADIGENLTKVQKKTHAAFG